MPVSKIPMSYLACLLLLPVLPLRSKKEENYNEGEISSTLIEDIVNYLLVEFRTQRYCCKGLGFSLVNRDEPWVAGRGSISQFIGLISQGFLPSSLRFSSRISLRAASL